MGVDNIKISPVNVFWQMEQVETFDFDGLTKSGLNGKFFQLNAALDADQYYVWGDNGGANPAPSGLSEISVDITGANTPAALAAAYMAAINSVTDGDGQNFFATVSGTVMSVKRRDIGETTLAADNDSDVVIALSRRGRDFDLGLLEGDVGLDFKPANFIVNSHQTGKTPLAALNQGFDKLECATSLLETQKSQLQALYEIYGGSFTPAADGSTKVFGVGSASQGKNMMVEAGRLIMKAVNAVDDSENFNLMLAVPVPESMTFSGEKPRMLKLSWQGFIDRDFNEKFNAIAIGDISQDLTEA